MNAEIPSSKDPLPRQTSRTVFVGSVLFMCFAWLLLGGFLALVWSYGKGTTSTARDYVLIGLAILAWALVPIQIARYFREKKRKNNG